MQNANNENQPTTNEVKPAAGGVVQDAATTQAKEVANVAAGKVGEVGGALQGQVQNVGAAANQQVKDMGKAAGQQLQNLGQAGVGQISGALGKMVNASNEAKQNQPPVGQQEKIYAMIGYIPFVALVSIIIKPDSAYVRLHAKQGLLLSIIFFLSGMMAAIVSLFGVLGQFLAFLIGLIPLACIILGIYSMYLAINGFWWKIPFISTVADLIPVEMMAKVSKENITGQIGVAKNDYDNRAETLQKEKTEKTGEAAAVTPTQGTATGTGAAEAAKPVEAPVANPPQNGGNPPKAN